MHNSRRHPGHANHGLRSFAWYVSCVMDVGCRDAHSRQPVYRRALLEELRVLHEQSWSRTMVACGLRAKKFIGARALRRPRAVRRPEWIPLVDHDYSQVQTCPPLYPLVSVEAPRLPQQAPDSVFRFMKYAPPAHLLLCKFGHHKAYDFNGPLEQVS